jgi:hypothetical protein
MKNMAASRPPRQEAFFFSPVTLLPLGGLVEISNNQLYSSGAIKQDLIQGLRGHPGNGLLRLSCVLRSRGILKPL